MRVTADLSNSERVERQAPPPSPLKGERGGVGLAAPKPLRESMPMTAEVIDAAREVFGAEPINAAIRSGLAGEPTFYAEEAGRVIGTPFPDGCMP